MRGNDFLLLLLTAAGPALAQTSAGEKPFVYDAAPLARRLDVSTTGPTVAAPAPTPANKAPEPPAPPPPHGFG